MKAIGIYSVGSCDAGTREGFCEVLLEYNGKSKYVHLHIHDTTANRCIIEGLLTGVRLIKEPCAVTLTTATKIGVERALRGKGVNFDLVQTLIAELQARRCTFDFDVWEGRGEELRSKVVSGRQGSAQFFGSPGAGGGDGRDWPVGRARPR